MAHYEWQPIVAWAPSVGRWTLVEDTQTYNGPQESMNTFGLCTSNIHLTEGRVRVSVQLSSIEDSAGRILLGYRSPTERYVSIGLGGYASAYTLSEFVPSYGWRGPSHWGSADNLSVGEQYTIEARLVGQRLSLTVNDVKILEHILDQPLIAGQVGLFAWGKHSVKFSGVAVSRVAGKVFVVMPFAEPYYQLYSEVLQPVAKEFGLQAYHAGEVFGPGVILQDITEGIIDAQIVIAEVTQENQNVFYELGYAHALGKPTILLAEHKKHLPFDIAGYRCLFYENTIGGKKQVEEALRKHLQAILREE